jgi:hypothetical protein
MKNSTLKNTAEKSMEKDWKCLVYRRCLCVSFTLAGTALYRQIAGDGTKNVEVMQDLSWADNFQWRACCITSGDSGAESKKIGSSHSIA